MRVPLVDLAAQHAAIRDEVTAAALAIVEQQAFILGEPVAAFERALADFCGARHAVGVACGTDAIELALRAAGVRAGDAVITTAFSFAATAEAIARAGARPIFADVDPRTLNVDPASVEERIVKHEPARGALRAIVPVHLYGACADMTALGAIAERHGLAIVEDAAQAIGAEHAERRAGSMGVAGCFSFFPSKNLGAWGDGGAVVTSDASVAEAVRRLRQHGVTRPYVHETLGANSRLDALQAAVLRVKLAHLPAWNDARARAAATYREALAGIDAIALPPAPEGGRHAYNLFVVRAQRRDDLRRHLDARGIESRVYYPLSLPKQPCFAAFEPDPCPRADEATRDVLALPMHAAISDDAIAYVADAVRAFYG